MTQKLHDTVAGVILLYVQSCPPSLPVYAVIFDEQDLISVSGDVMPGVIGGQS